jgi:hypothetical protein
MRRSSCVLVLSALLGHAQTWSNANPSNIGALGYNGYLNIVWNSLTGSTMGLVRGGSSSGIYSNTLFSLDSSAVVAVVGSSGTSNTDLCGGGSATWPSDRHPQIWWDSLRSRVWLYGGVCNGGSATDTWYFQVNSSLTNTAWSRKSPVNHPDCNGITGSIAHDTINDIFVMYCSNSGSAGRTWVYCDTSLSGGSLTLAQQAAGCNRAGARDNWANVTPGIVPLGSQMPTLAFDSRSGDVVMFGGTYSSLLRNQTWSYNDQARKWTNRNPSTSPPVNQAWAAGPLPFAYDSSDGRFYYHYSGGASDNSDWAYDNSANTWSALGNLGGPHYTGTWAFDSINNRFVAWNDNVSAGGLPEFWYLSLQAPGGGGGAGSVAVSSSANGGCTTALSNPYTIQATFPSGHPVAGSSVIVSAGIFNPLAVTRTVTDNQPGNVYVEVAAPAVGGGNSGATMFAAHHINASGAFTVTLTVNVADYLCLNIYEVTGLPIGTTEQRGVNQSAISSGSSTVTAGGSVAPTNGIVFVNAATISAQTPGAGMIGSGAATLGQHTDGTANAINLADEYRVISSSETLTGTMSFNPQAIVGYSTMMGVFK